MQKKLNRIIIVMVTVLILAVIAKNIIAYEQPESCDCDCMDALDLAHGELYDPVYHKEEIGHRQDLCKIYASRETYDKGTDKYKIAMNIKRLIDNCTAHFADDCPIYDADWTALDNPTEPMVDNPN